MASSMEGNSLPSQVDLNPPLQFALGCLGHLEEKQGVWPCIGLNNTMLCLYNVLIVVASIHCRCIACKNQPRTQNCFFIPKGGGLSDRVYDWF